MAKTAANIRSHGSAPLSVDEFLESKRRDICARGDLEHASQSEQLEVLEAFASFPLGLFLLQNGGLNGFWTDYMLRWPDTAPSDVSEFERKVVTRAPAVRATRERHKIFQRVLQDALAPGMRVASVPSGLMPELLSLPTSVLDGVRITAVDLDQDSLTQLESRVAGGPLEERVTTRCADALALPLDLAVDVLASNGLNIYLPDKAEELRLFQQFLQALTPGGLLLTSFLTPPPNRGACEWRMDAIDQEMLRISRIALADITRSAWQNYHTTAEFVALLAEVGFVDVRVHPDPANMMPAVTARRSDR